MFNSYSAYDTFILCGSEVYYLIDRDMIIKATVVETSNFFDNNIWVSRSINSDEDYISIPNGKKDEHGWDESDTSKDFSILDGLKQCSQFLWLDEYSFGHELSLGEECFLSLNDAMQCVRPSRRKRLKRRLNAFRSQGRAFIASTWEKPFQSEEYVEKVENHPPFPKLPMKRVYIKRK